MEWSDDFLVYATVGDSLLRTIDDESALEIDAMVYIPSLTNVIMTIIKEGPIHMHSPQAIPRCSECGKETDNEN